MGLSLTLRPVQRLTHRLLHRLTNQQRLVLREAVLTLRHALHETLHDGDYTPRAECPRCAHRLTQLEILNGFRSDPRDFTTECSRCKHRFEARLIRPLGYAKAELVYLCPDQTLHALRGLEGVPPPELSTTHAAVYHSAILHFSSIKKAFERVGTTYDFEEIFNWKDKVSSFLGKLPDTTIASCVDVPVREVRVLRRENKILPYNARRLIREAPRE